MFNLYLVLGGLFILLIGVGRLLVKLSSSHTDQDDCFKQGYPGEDDKF